MNSLYRTALPGTALEYYDTCAAIEAIEAGAYRKMSYTAKILAENLVRRCDPQQLTLCLQQIIGKKSEIDFPWYPARVVCHDILGQTALVDLAGLRDAIAEQINQWCSEAFA